MEDHQAAPIILDAAPPSSVASRSETNPNPTSAVYTSLTCQSPVYRQPPARDLTIHTSALADQALADRLNDLPPKSILHEQLAGEPAQTPGGRPPGRGPPIPWNIPHDFSYENLKKPPPRARFGSFRLLVLHPAVEYDRVSADLNSYSSFRVAPRYTALSYRWGELERRKRVYIDNTGGHIYVTSNCHDALVSMRSSHNNVLWVDSICINQDDYVEKAEQLRFMGHIYQQASKCIGYVGRLDSSARAVFYGAQTGWNDGDLSPKLVQFLDREWFHRVWVIQEVLLARKLELQCGDMNIGWNAFCRIYESTIRPFESIPGDTSSPRTLPELRHWYKMHCSREDTAILDPSAPVDPSVPIGGLAYSELFDFLLATRYFQCSDSRDKLFGLVSLFNTKIPELLRPDYSRHSSRVWNRVSEYILRMGDARVLVAAQGTFGDEWAGSWAVNWQSLQNGEEPISLKAVERLKPATTSHEKLNVLFPQTLNLATVSLDTHVITKVTFISPEILEEACKTVLGLQLHWASVVEGIDEESTSVTGLHPFGLRFGIRKLIHWLPKPSATLPPGVEFLQGQRFFNTAAGILGIAPQNVKIGDTVCMLARNQFPVLVFQESAAFDESDTKRWQIVGPCILIFTKSSKVSRKDALAATVKKLRHLMLC